VLGGELWISRNDILPVSGAWLSFEYSAIRPGPDCGSPTSPFCVRVLTTLAPWTERLTNFVLEFTAMILNLEIHPEAQRASTVAADSLILSKGAQL
jgi:hypothetical protein